MEQNRVLDWVANDRVVLSLTCQQEQEWMEILQNSEMMKRRMVSMKKLDDMIADLLDMDIVKADNTVVFSNEARQLIHEIAEKCNTIPIVDETREQAEEYAKGLSAEQVYTDMLYKIVEAPTRIHMRVSARMLIPIIDQKLQNVREEG